MTPIVTPPLQYLQLKKKLEDEFPGRLDIVSLGGRGGTHTWVTLPVPQPWWQWGVGATHPSPSSSPLGRVGVPKRASQPLQHLSPQCGEGTPQVTGFFEVMVAGKLVHSKKVCLSVHPASFWGWCGGVVVDGGGLGVLVPAHPFPLPSTPGRRWLRGHREQVSEAGGRHQSRLGSGRSALKAEVRGPAPRP